jgi:hypothetical protein
MQKLALTFKWKVKKLAKERGSFFQLQQEGDNWLVQWLFKKFSLIPC